MVRHNWVGLVAFAAGLGGCTSLLGDFNVGDASVVDATSDAQPESGPDAPPDVGKDSPVESGPTCGNLNQQCCAPNSTCNQGACCGNQCTDTAGDGLNCGACGHTCFGQQCISGMCQPEKLTQYADTRPGRVRLDQGAVYFITVNANSSGSLYVCKQTGCATPTPLIKNLSYAYDMVLDDNFANVYVADSTAQKLYYCFTSGCNLVPGIVPTAAQGNVYGLAFRSNIFANISVQPHEFKVDGSSDVSLGNGNEGANYIAAPKQSQHVYWQSNPGHVRVANDNVAQSSADYWVSTNNENVFQVEGDAGWVAWVAEGSNGTKIYTCADGLNCNGNNVIASGNVGYETGSLTIDGPTKTVYWTGVDSTSSHVYVKGCPVTANCNNPVTVANIGTKVGGAVAGGVAVNNSYVYFTLEDAGTIYLYRVAK